MMHHRQERMYVLYIRAPHMMHNGHVTVSQSQVEWAGPIEYDEYVAAIPVTAGCSHWELSPPFILLRHIRRANRVNPYGV